MSFISDFSSITHKQKNNETFIYLDSAASSLTPDVVVESMVQYYSEYRSNVHRGLYASAERATTKVEAVRSQVAEFLGVLPEELIFTSGATMSMNLIVLLLEKNIILSEGDEIRVSEYAHSSLLLPLQELAKRTNVKLIYGFEELSSHTKIVAMPLVSNVTGEIYKVRDIFEEASRLGAFCICDATAAVTHLDIQMNELHADALFVSAHKMYGPTGVGALALSKKYIDTFIPVFFGGGMPDVVGEVDSRYVEGVGKFEPGTPPIAEIIGFGAAVSYIHSAGEGVISNYVAELHSYIYQEFQKLPYISIYTDVHSGTGIISFNVEGIHSHDVAQILADDGICVRAGSHCAHHTMKKLQCNSTCRVSLQIYNTKEDIDILIATIKKARKIFGLTI